MARRPVRQRSQLPHCYYEGYLEKSSVNDKDPLKLWTCLCGNTIFFFNDKRNTDYIEKLDLNGLISITDDSSEDSKSEAARLTLQMKDDIIKFTAPNAQARELWKGFITSVVELSVPTTLNLLPGQMQMMKEAVEKERERVKKSQPSLPFLIRSAPLSIVQTDMPVCYHRVSRLEAELLLSREFKNGNLLLRPGRDKDTFAISTRQDLNGSIFKHYRVSPKQEGGYAIDVENPNRNKEEVNNDLFFLNRVRCATLHDVIDYLVERTDGVLVPLTFEEQYEKNISFILSDHENGEKSIQEASSSSVPPSVPPKRVAPRIPAPSPAEEDLYLNCDMPKPDNKPPSKAMMPPVPAPRKTVSTVPSSFASSNRETNVQNHNDPMGQTISELKLKFEKQVRGLD